MDSPDSTTTATHNLIPTRSAAADIVHNDIVLSEADADAIQASADFALAPATRRVYRSLWQGFDSWCRSRGYEALPAAAVAVAAFLAARAQTSSAATLSLSAAAIGYYHRQHSLPNPTDSQGVKLVLAGLARQHRAGSQRQAKGLSREDLAAIRATACQPRIGRGGRPESARHARNRGLKDIALCSIMWDAMLRRAEAAALTWADVRRAADSSGRLTVQHSKTDQSGAGKVLWISPSSMSALELVASLQPQQPTDPLFNLSPPQITRRIAQACKAAGLGNGYSGHSPRVGAAQALAAANLSLPAIMQHGRWQSPTMVAKYTRDSAAAQSAMAKLYAQGG